MKVVILAGGKGTRLTEENDILPKPMVSIGGQPILWHVMKIYSAYGFNDFVICCGYKGHTIKEYFADYYLHQCDVTYDFRHGGAMTVHSDKAEPWSVTLVDTGLETMTGSRIRKVKNYLGNDPFMLTYGDGVSDVDINAVLAEHRRSGMTATITAIQPGGRFGMLDIYGDRIVGFREKSQEDGGWINGGFMVMEPEIMDYLGDGDDCVLERRPLETLAKEGKLGVHCHDGFWQCMDTPRDRALLEHMWNSGEAKWKVWE